jgi:hypothetical protein
MAALGLPMPGAAAPGAAPAPSAAKVISIGGFLPIGNVAAALQMDERSRTAAFEQKQSSPLITGLAGHIKTAWSDAKEARNTVEQEMIEAMLARRGQYTAEKQQQIKDNRQPAIYMMVASAKMRQVESLLRDVIIGTGSEKPWTLKPTPVPEVPPEIAAEMLQRLQMEIMQSAASGFFPSVQQAQIRLRQMRDELAPMLMEEAAKRVERMEQKMEDQLVEGGYMEALDQFITDLATFKTAFLAGPIVRKRPQLSWGQGGEMVVEDKLTLHWERVDPFDMYPARYAACLDDGPLIRKHRLSRRALTEMIGVEGFDDEAIRKVLDQFGDSGLHEWLSIDSQKQDAEGKEPQTTAEKGVIDALQYWGSASGKMLRDWGMDEAEAPDPATEYNIEAWVIGSYVIKAVLNADPLARRPYYGASFQRVPGSVWGSAPYDLLRDCQDMCNGAARALAANMGISSGPQVGILADRIPAGEEVKEMFPWKIWQFDSDQSGGSAKPMEFFQPESNANELMGVYEKFSLLADEYTGIPRYMAGFNEGSGGAGRTASGMSMMIGNASKVIKQVMGTIDTQVFTPMLERLYYYNMRYSDDDELKGDINIVARGAASLVAKDAAAVRANEFLSMVLSSEMAQQILGIEGVAELMRPTVKRLDMNPDKVVPPLPVLRQRAAELAMIQMQMAQQQQGPEGEPAAQPMPGPSGSGQALMNGAPQTDNFSPPKQ